MNINNNTIEEDIKKVNKKDKNKVYNWNKELEKTDFRQVSLDQRIKKVEFEWDKEE